MTVRNIENIELSLSLGHSVASATQGLKVRRRTKRSADGMFECKTCNRSFPSFQALGGHRTSHQRARIDRDGARGVSKKLVHNCPVCGLGFAMGQALGGHMRRHKTTLDGDHHVGHELDYIEVPLGSMDDDEGGHGHVHDGDHFDHAWHSNNLVLLDLFK